MAFASGQAQWLRELTDQDWVQGIRVDGQRNLLAIAETVALWADWDSLESRPTWEELVQASGVSARTVARWLLELRLRGWLELIEHGTTPTTRPMSLAHLEGNRAAVYALRLPLTPQRAAEMAAELMLAELAAELDHLSQPRTVAQRAAEQAPDTAGAATEYAREAPCPAQAPDQLELVPVEESGTPSWSCRSLVERSTDGSSRARKPVDNSWFQVSDQGKQRLTALRAGSEEQQVPDLLIMIPVGRYEMLACADALRRAHPLFGRCSRKLVRSLCRPYWRAGWCARDILHALEHRPSMFTQVKRLSAPESVVSPRQLIASRLAAWRDKNGRVRPGWWTEHTARPASGTGGSRARQRVRARHGQAGARLLRAGEHALSVERIAAHGRALRIPGSDGSHRRAEAQAAERGARERLRAELLRQAHAALARDRDENTGPGQAVAAPGGAAATPAGGAAGSVHERAVARARAEGHLPHRRRSRRRWT